MQLTGDLAKVSLANLLQLVRNGALTGKIAMQQGVKTATVYLDNGQIIHVELDVAEGREALMELFLWANGSFSFYEQDVKDVPRSLRPEHNQEDSLERLVRDGLSYLEQKSFLDQNQISGQSVLVPADIALEPQTWSSPERQAIYALVEPILTRIDGRKTLAEALADARLLRREFVVGVYTLLSGGFAFARKQQPDVDEFGERVNLPAWVVARLKQDNADLSQSIVDMVIWVDRVKCWMYQVDADFTQILEEVEMQEEVDAPDEDFFAQLNQGEVDVQEPLFGEPSIESNESQPAKAVSASEYFGRNSAPMPEEQDPSPVRDKPASAQSDKLTGTKKAPPSIEF